MCNVFYKEFKGWWRSFTKTEIALTILQVALFIVFTGFLTFLILHLMACSNAPDKPDMVVTQTTPELNTKSLITSVLPTTKSIPLTALTTLAPEIECTWEPSKKTDAVVHYYESGQISSAMTNYEQVPTSTTLSSVDEADELTDGESADSIETAFLLALVKMKIRQDVTFGCVLTIVSKYCTLTAASCIESIEELDAVDSFVMMEGYGERHMGRIHTVSDVLIHPEYQGTNEKYDVAVLKSQDGLLKKGQAIVRLPTMLDTLAITIGEQFSLLGYGRFRRAVRELRVHTLPSAQCSGSWSLRHLSRGAALRTSECGSAPLCAGPLHNEPAAAGASCDYCAGTPLLRDTLLLGIMAAGPCGDSCEPAIYVNLATIADWLNSILTVE